jgi:hypothetical protein
MNSDQHNAQLTHELVTWAGLKYMIKKMKPESAISTSSVNRVHKIQKYDRGETESTIYLDIIPESLGLKISHSFT